ncbi:PD-(D/E)XK nuclease family protein [Patescibacteria group bacterium]|nr:PD-(D/E)XK nuclease family protein [Patescibacteria group bacterium]
MAWQKGAKLYRPGSSEPFKVSRSKIDLFRECPRCFYLDRRLGVSRPSMPGFSLNSAVDHLLKKEFDALRKSGKPHEIMKRYGVDAVPFVHKDLDVWRENFVGKQVLHGQTNFIVFGAVDDLWVNPQGELIVVDYKSTSTDKEISLKDQWKVAYKKQLETYQWLFRESGFAVSNQAYIVYANAAKSPAQFDGKLEFELTLHEHRGDTSWVAPMLAAMKSCLEDTSIPDASTTCEYCIYRKKAGTYETTQGQLML